MAKEKANPGNPEKLRSALATAAKRPRYCPSTKWAVPSGQ